MAVGIQGTFFGLSNSFLTPLLTNYQNCLTAIATAGQNYSIAGRTFTRANIAQVSQMIAEIQAAIDRNNGARVTETYARFSGGLPGIPPGIGGP